jgi:hypothetical protein
MGALGRGCGLKRFPGAAQHDSDALQTRDRYKRYVLNDPGSAVHRVQEKVAAAVAVGEWSSCK